MKLVADERVDAPIVDRLRRDGYQVVYVAELEPGIDDERILALATDDRALLITADKDFGELVYRLRRLTSGVLLIRLAGLSAPRKADVVTSTIDAHLDRMSGAFTVLRPGSLRIRSVG